MINMSGILFHRKTIKDYDVDLVGVVGVVIVKFVVKVVNVLFCRCE